MSDVSAICRRHLDRIELEQLGPVKRCASCREFLPADREFFHGSGRRGLDACCKACRYERRVAA